MATVESNAPQFNPLFPVRLLTASDLAALPETLPSGPVTYELHRGRLVMMSPPGRSHGITQLKIGAVLALQGSMAGHGEAWTEVGILLHRDPDTLLTPDVAFAGKALLPLKESKEGYIETIPDLVVEVRSKNDSMPDVLEKVKTYLAAGVGQVWIADPKTHNISIHRSDIDLQTIESSDSITDSHFPIIPGLKLLLAEVFPTE